MESDWYVYTQDGDAAPKELESLGSDIYSGLDYGGQIFYYERGMTEEADSPTLKIDSADRCVSVFLDGALLYTDCPELDNRIGYLELPMLGYVRKEPVTVSLPSDYVVCTLTVAQSSPADSEAGGDATTVFLSEITLYCGYSYESGLISSATQTAIPAVLLFGLEIVLLAAFVWNAVSGRLYPEFPVLALSVVLTILTVYCGADFFSSYFRELTWDPQMYFLYFSIAVLLLFLGAHIREESGLFLFAAVHGLVCCIAALLAAGGLVKIRLFCRRCAPP